MVKYTKKEKRDDRDKYDLPFDDPELISKMSLENPVEKQEENQKNL